MLWQILGSRKFNIKLTSTSLKPDGEDCGTVNLHSAGNSPMLTVLIHPRTPYAPSATLVRTERATSWRVAYTGLSRDSTSRDMTPQCDSSTRPSAQEP